MAHIWKIEHRFGPVAEGLTRRLLAKALGKSKSAVSRALCAEKAYQRWVNPGPVDVHMQNRGW